MNDLRTAAQQALEALDAGVPISPKSILHDWFRAALAQQAEQRRATPVMQQALEILESDFTTVDGEFCRWCDGRLNAKHNCKLEQTIAALRAALAQQAEPVEPVDVGLLEYRGNSVAFIHQKMTAYRTGIDAAWDAFRANGLHPDGKTSLADMIAKYTAPPKAEPVQEPVAWRYKPMIGSSWSLSDDGYYISCKRDKGYIVEELHTVLSQRTMVPLTDEEILAAVGWERAAMYMKLTPNFPVDEAKKETLTNARAVEKASWEKNHGQA